MTDLAPRLADLPAALQPFVVTPAGAFQQAVAAPDDALPLIEWAAVHARPLTLAATFGKVVRYGTAGSEDEVVIPMRGTLAAASLAQAIKDGDGSVATAVTERAANMPGVMGVAGLTTLRVTVR